MHQPSSDMTGTGVECSEENTSSAGKQQVEVIKSTGDKRLYRAITLENGLCALLIHDPEIAASQGEGGDSVDGSCDDKGGAVRRSRRRAGPGRGCASDSEEEDDSYDEDDEDEDDDEDGDGDDDEDSGWETADEERTTAVLVNGVPGDKGDEGEDGCGDHCEGCKLCGNESDEEDDDGSSEDESDGPRRDMPKGGAKKAAAAMCVGVGSFSDPLDAQGLAHFLEHMLFMGSEKFPNENDYDSFLSAHGGSSNAYTDAEHTCFHFEVNHKFLTPALDRFAQFFVAPLAKDEAMEREVQSVDSEFNQSVQNDRCRLQQLQCHTANSAYELHKFSWGNRKSLGEPLVKGKGIRGKLINLYKEHYRAGRMKLVVLGAEPLDGMEKTVKELFVGVRPGGTERLNFAREGRLWEKGKMYIVQSVKDQHQLSLQWPLPCLDSVYRKKPYDYVSHLIGHEGAGSILSLLKAKGLAQSLTAGIGDSGFERNSAMYLFSISIRLTVLGLEKVMDVIGLVYEYIHMAKEVGPQEWVFRELKSVADMEFRFAEEDLPEDYTCRLAENMHLYPEEHIISGEYIVEEWDPALVEDVFNWLSPENMRVDLVTRSFDNTSSGVLVEPWFGVRYRVKDIDAELVERWAKPPSSNLALHMPLQNLFIPHDFTLRVEPVKLAEPVGDSGQLCDVLTPSNSAPAKVMSSLESSGKATSLQAPLPEAVLTESSAEVMPPGSCAKIMSTELTMKVTLAELPAEVDDAAGTTYPKTMPETSDKLTEPAPPSSPNAVVKRFPKIIYEDDCMKLHYLKDTVFKTPRASVYFAITSGVFMQSAKNVVLGELFVKLHADALSETVYLASVARLDWNATLSASRLEFKFHGFNDKLGLLVKTVFEQLRDFKVQKDRFEVVKEELVRDYGNANMKPWKHSAYLRLRVLRERGFPVEERLDALLSCTPEDLASFVPAMLDQTFTECLAHGNLTEEEALELVKTVQSCLPQKTLRPEHRPVERIVQLTDGVSYVINARAKLDAEENSVVEMYLQMKQDWGKETVRDRAIVDLLEHIIWEPSFDQLRTKEQLGYSVECSVRVTQTVMGLCFRVQSAEYHPRHVHSRIDAFIEDFRNYLVTMTDEQFSNHQEALISQKLEKDTNLEEESDRHWAQIWDNRYLFNARKLEAQALHELKMKDVLQCYDSYLSAASTSRRKLAVQIWGKNCHAMMSEVDDAMKVADGCEKPGDTALIKDIAEFKRRAELFPTVRPVPVLSSSTVMQSE
ncbi:hypothetical protein CBR_g27959 [Chara braunii]|uniref:Peptidase M16 N-terminal domain-containing protein n=1 Tax=Chara braunii TaxID=69332 RepID=A0A388L8V8_CHABU|nr:hypothetical protein CBR_g27959 [Chara braunii]|eukprot:GBG78735.1 hypothetical protein CBR_g27959 [Chara braunii]